MVNFREVNNDDILKDWFNIREQEVFGILSLYDRKHEFSFEEITEKFLRNVPK